MSKLITDIATITDYTMSKQHKVKNLHLMLPFLTPSSSHINTRAWTCDSKQYYFHHYDA